jgi:4-amino-4-deoxy-L-arabinose transferase-like glycosyltransferase
MKQIPYRRWLPWLGLLCVLVAYVISVVRLHPTNFFGLTQDDTIYFSSAKALADGQGYILPSVPGTPRATHYPVLYPWILSWVWRFNPSFPGNVASAIGVTVAFGCIFLTAAFVFLRQLNAFSDLEALLLSLFCAIQPVVRVYSANVLSDIPFAAFVLVTIVLSNFTVRRNPGTVLAAACGILAGLTMFIRVLGVPVAAGIVIAMLLRREWRKAAVFSGCVAPFFAVLAWRALFSAPNQAPVALATCSAVWQGTWLSYTSYVGFFKIVSTHKGIFWPIFKQNTLLLLLQPGIYFADPRFIHPSDLGTVFTCLLSAIVFFGLLHLGRKTGWQPIHFSLALYIVPLLFWSYPVVERCLLPFLPLFAAGIWAEWRRLAIQIWQSLGSNQFRTERWALGLLSLVLVIFAAGIGLAQKRNSDVISQESLKRGLLLSEKHEVYSWLKTNTPPGSRAVAYEDVNLFLFSGRQALRPITFSPAGLYDPSFLKNDVACITSGAQGIQATYWVMSDDDFSIEWTDATSAGLARESQLGDSLPEVFRSKSGRVRVYGLKTLSGVDLLAR